MTAIAKPPKTRAQKAAATAELERELAIWKAVAASMTGDVDKKAKLRRLYRLYRDKLYPALGLRERKLRKIDKLAADTRGNENMRAVAAAMAAKLRAEL